MGALGNKERTSGREDGQLGLLDNFAEVVLNTLALGPAWVAHWLEGRPDTLRLQVRSPVKAHTRRQRRNQ